LRVPKPSSNKDEHKKIVQHNAEYLSQNELLIFSDRKGGNERELLKKERKNNSTHGQNQRQLIE
jgi:hypothetical protein